MNTRAESTHPQLIDILEDKLSMSSSAQSGPMDTSTATDMTSRQTSTTSVINDASKEQILIQTIYTFSNIATGNLSHKKYVLERPRIIQAVVESLVRRTSRCLVFSFIPYVPPLISFLVPSQIIVSF
jgi:hypothetical protein